jgi:hypothetical protein
MSEPLASKQDAIEQLRKADERWACALRGFDDYPVRLRTLADAANNRSRALMLAELANITWIPRPGASNLRLAYELEEASGRPGPKAMWKTFDHAVKEIGLALEGESITAVARAFRELSTLAGELADACKAAAETEQKRQQTG